MTRPGLPFVPPAQPQPPLPKIAPAPLQFSRLLDALAVLDAQGSCKVSDLADRVGLQPERLRELLSAYMVAGAEALGPDAPFNLDFGTEQGPVGTEPEDDASQAGADTVRLSSLRGPGHSLLDDVGRRPVMVRDVARALLAARLLLAGELDRRDEVAALSQKLADAMRAVVDAPAVTAASTLQSAVRDRQRVRFRYLHPWTGVAETVETAPYDVRRRRDRLVLDAQGDPFTTYDLGGVSDVALVGAPGAFVVPDLPAAEGRTPAAEVVLRVPRDSAAESWLLTGWSAMVVGPVGGDMDLRIDLDGDVADPAVAQRLGVLLLQLGPTARVVRPEVLRDAAVSVGRRLLQAHGG